MQSKILLYFFLISLFFSCKKKDSTTAENRTLINNQIDTLKILSETPIESFKLLGKFNYKNDTTFAKVPSSYSFKNIYVQKVVLDSFIKMTQTAEKEGVSFKIVSGTRNFDEQKRIWERKWKRNNTSDSKSNALQILKYSSMPSTSRHHWGTDIDLNNLNNSYFEKGKGLKEYNWLINNANKFGFFQPYTSKDSGRTGYNEEKWHWSFKPLSSHYLNVYKDSISYKDINGFVGSDVAKDIDVIKNYVNGIEY
jgi:zinc D-Ala-D-Ala carboxypeptidase